MKLQGRNTIITGASQGLGLEIAKQFVREGANVLICARDAATLQEAHNSLMQLRVAQQSILAKQADVSKVEEIDQLLAYGLSEWKSVDVLVANAGIYGPKGPIEEIDWKEWSEAIDINLKGTVLQCRSLVPVFKKQGHGKIIVLSGGGATKPMPNLSAYAASKAGVVRFAETLAEELRSFHIDVNTVAPGALNTRLLDEILSAGPEKVGRAFYEQSLKQRDSGGTPLKLAAELCVFLASSVSDGISGKLISAAWDPWAQLPEYLDDLKNSDIYTLRRIVPKDRDRTWGDV